MERIKNILNRTYIGLPYVEQDICKSEEKKIDEDISEN